MTTAAVAAAAGPGARVVSGDPGRLVSGVSLATSTLRPGDLWAALRGARAHGAQYAEAALAAGAAAVLTDDEGLAILAAAGVDLPVVACADPRARLGAASAAVYGTVTSPVRLLGVTGTNGKTTTTYLLDSALRALGRTTGLVGTVETRVGETRVVSERTTPESPDLHGLLAVMGEQGVTECLMEVSSHALELHRVDGLRFDVAIFTNLSQDHLDFHGTMEAYYAAKARLFTAQRSRAAVVCVDDAWGRRLAAEATVPVTTVASTTTREAGVAARDGRTPGGLPAADVLILGDPDDPALVLRHRDGRQMLLRSALPGAYNRVNTALAAVALQVLGLPDEEVTTALHAPVAVPGRMERVPAPAQPPDAPAVVVDFAHTPDAVSAALTALRAGCAGHLVAVLGAGGSRDPGKRPAMGAAAATTADVVVVTDDNPREEDPAAIRAVVAQGARTGPAAVEVVPGRRAAVARAVALARAAGPGGVVALLGKGHEQGQEIAGVVHPYDDRAVAAEILATLDPSPQPSPDGGAA